MGIDHAAIQRRIRVVEPARVSSFGEELEAVPCPDCGLNALQPLGYAAEKRRLWLKHEASFRTQFAMSRLEHPTRRPRVLLP